MSSVNTQRYESGPVEEGRGFTLAGETNHIGDLIAQGGANNKYFKNYDNLGGTESFHDHFWGVLQQGATLGSETVDTPGLVYTAGEFRFPLDVPALAYYAAGSLVGVAGTQTVSLNIVPQDSIGIARDEVNIGDTTVLVKILSTVAGESYQNPL